MADWESCPAVESVPGRLSGAWVFTGTRVPVSSLFANLAEGVSDVRINRFREHRRRT